MRTARPGPGERLARDDALVELHEAPDRAHLVLEELAQGLDEVHLEVVRQAADVVVALDDRRVAAVRGDGLDHVRVQGALAEEVRLLEAGGLRAEHVDEVVPDLLALELGVGDPREAVEEAVGRVHGGQVEPQVLAELGLDDLALAFAEQPVVDEDAVQAVADRPVHERGRDRAVDAAGEAEHDLALIADLRAHLLDLAVDDRARVPVAGEIAHLVEEVAQDLLAALGVADLGVELHPEEAARRVAHGRELARSRVRVRLEAGGHADDLVAVAHPDDRAAVDAGEGALGLAHVDLGVAELALAGAVDVAAELAAHPLHPVADAQHGDAELEHAGRDGGRVVRVHRSRTARQDDASQVHASRRLQRLRRRRDLAPGLGFAHAARDELGVLGPEVDDQDATRGVGLG